LRAFLLVLILCLLLTSASSPEIQPALSLMPIPASVQVATGQLVLGPTFSVAISGHSDAKLRSAVERFLAQLGKQTGLPPIDLKLADGPNATLLVHAERASKAVPELGEDESYALSVAASGAKLNAKTTLGVLRGLETFLQLVQTSPAGFAVPAVIIHDQPRFPWRGLMIDVGRHFMPIDVLKRNLDGMAAVKLNVFHWHLSENQGFRVESKRFPRLQELGSDGFFYTQQQVRDLIAYAHDRGIRVVPEFDMPGHSTAWFVGYPELGSGQGRYAIERKWGIFDPAMNPADERTYAFLDQLIGEMAALFPDKYFHIGGDEVNGKEWDANPKIQAFKRNHGLKSNQDLQAYFNRRVQKIVSRHGKIMIGWDEILQPDLPKDIVVQSWRGQASLAAAARQGVRGLLSYGYYLDLMWPTARHYAVDPMSDDAATLKPEEQQRILGGEACMWSEYVSPENIDSRIWPRMAVIAERLWSPQNVKDAASMYDRLEATGHWLEWFGLTHHSSYDPMLQRIAGSNDIAALRTLADVVEPVKDYTREETAPVEPTSLLPLNRLIDAARPESSAARKFSAMVDTLLAGKASPEMKDQMRAQLTRWRENDAKLENIQAPSSLLKEVLPLSQELSGVASIGLQAMDYLDRREAPPLRWKAEQSARLQFAQQQQAQLLLMVAPPVQRLLEATGQGW